jgi:hypothetical protein
MDIVRDVNTLFSPAGWTGFKVQGTGGFHGKQRISYDPSHLRIDAATSRFGCLPITVFLTPVPTLCYKLSNALLRAIRRD